MLKKYIYLTSILLLCVQLLSAQSYTATVQKIGVDDGLSSYKIFNIYQDSRGLIWIATSYGLNSYDGTTIEVYTKETHGLCHNIIHTIEEDQHGNLWLMGGDIGRGSNMCIFDPVEKKTYSIEEYTNAPCPFQTYNMWLCNRHRDHFLLVDFVNGQVYELIDKKLQPTLTFKETDQAVHHFDLAYVYKMTDSSYALLRRGPNVYSGLAYLNSQGELIREDTIPNGLGRITRIATDGQNLTTLYGSTDSENKNNIISFKTNDLSPISIKSPLGSYKEPKFHKNKFYILSSKSLKIYTSKGQLIKVLRLDLDLTNDIIDLTIDNQENIWFKNKKHLYCISLHQQPFEVSLHNNTSPNRIRGITKTQDNSLFIGTTGLFFKTKADSLSMEAGQNFNLYPSNYMGILEDDNNIWIATEYRGLLQYNWQTQQVKSYHTPASLPNAILWMPYKATDGSIWVGTVRGLVKLDTIQEKLLFFTPQTEFVKLSTSAIYSFHHSPKGTWLCTSSGLYLVNLEQEKVLEYYSDSQKGDFYIPTNHIAHLHEDKDGLFWLATKGQGLIKWNPKTKNYEQLTRSNTGLSNDVLYAVYEDASENLWISSDRGLMSLNKGSRLVTIYQEEDGIPHNEFNTVSHYKDTEGHLYFGGQNGIINFHPRDFKQQNYSAPFIVTSCTKQERSTDNLIQLTSQILKQHSLTIYSNDKSVSIKFALLNYKKAKNTQYSYKIEGYDKDWTYQAEPFLKISGLPYGNYKLRLRAKASGSGIWQDYDHAIQIKVVRPFYLQWWFILSAILLFILSIFFIIKRRTQKLLEKQEELEQLVEKRTKKIAQQAEELKALDKVKSRFFANISHELRTPLTLILGPLSYILDNPDDWEKEDIKQQLLTMQRNGKSLMQLIEEILDLSKLEANKLELNEEATPVKQFFEHIFIVFEPQFQSQGLDYELIFNLEHPDLTVLIDRKKLEKILNNFLSNAIKFTPSLGKITLAVQETTTHLNIKVSDTGKGVHPSDLPHIFERFYQSKLAERKLYGGTGIGLALVSEFATLMGAKAYAKSTLGSGSHFYFELPKKVVEISHAVFQPAMLDLAEELIDSIGTDFTILVVEDNYDMRNFVCQLLQKRYKTVLSAQNGAEGLELLQEYGTEIHLVVSDIMMPEVDGLSMLKQIKANPLWNGIPVIMLTALAAERDKLTALTIGVDDYLTKPFSVTELLVRTQNLLYNYHQRLEWQKTLPTPQMDSSAPEGKATSDTQIELTTTQKKWITDLETTIKDSLKTELLNVEGLAAKAFLSKKQLNRKIKAITGLTTAKFIKEIQLQQARQELETGSFISITEVAFNNGFEQPSTFSTVFKKRFGKSPSEYAK
ncbi:MAG: response regulator [Aureispira sp.]|nr:response regulator [Aureispira sp.]